MSKYFSNTPVKIDEATETLKKEGDRGKNVTQLDDKSLVLIVKKKLASDRQNICVKPGRDDWAGYVSVEISEMSKPEIPLTKGNKVKGIRKSRYLTPAAIERIRPCERFPDAADFQLDISDDEEK